MIWGMQIALSCCDVGLFLSQTDERRAYSDYEDDKGGSRILEPDEIGMTRRTVNGDLRPARMYGRERQTSG